MKSPRPIRVRFLRRREIRMGSPHRACDLSLTGDWVPALPEGATWQDRKAWSPDGSHLALVEWNTSGNTPGFHVHVVSVKGRTVTRTRRIRGLCEGLQWKEDRFVYWTLCVRQGSVRPGRPARGRGQGGGKATS